MLHPNYLMAVEEILGLASIDTLPDGSKVLYKVVKSERSDGTEALVLTAPLYLPNGSN